MRALHQPQVTAQNITGSRYTITRFGIVDAERTSPIASVTTAMPAPTPMSRGREMCASFRHSMSVV